MGFKTGMRYRLADPERYDDEYGEGFGYAEVYGEITCEGMFICDCWITDKEGKVHPGLRESPVPVRVDDVIPDTAEPALNGERRRKHVMWA